MSHNNDLLAAFVVLFFSLMLYAYTADHGLDFTALGTMQSGIIETDGE
jgi:hypothetical protein